MCGIVGVVLPSGEAPVDAIRAALPAVRHRGPDAESARGFQVGSGSCAVGHTRLRVIDTSDRADQPLGNEDGTVWAYLNGELYNHIELRRELEAAGHRFSTTTDTEVLAHLYEQVDGEVEAMLKRLRGMYAIALVDQARGRVTLARDRLGIKPMYVSTTSSGGVAFASEARAIVATGLVPCGPDSVSLIGYLVWGSVPGPGTAYAGVRELPAGAYLMWTAEGFDTHVWWRPMFTSHVQADAAAGTLRDALTDSVSRHLVADREVGLFLSGGVDSHGLAALVGAQGLRSLTVTFPDAGGDEGSTAGSTAARLGLRHEEVPITGTELAAVLPDIARAMDQPTSDGVNSWIVSRAASDAGMVVALSGLGGDELFGGYPSFELVPRALIATAALGPVPPTVRRWAADAVAGRRPGDRLARVLQASSGFAHAYRAVRSLFGTADMQRLGVSRWLDATEIDSSFTPQEPPRGNQADRVAHLELTRYMRQQLLRDTDQMSMAHSLEVRVPLLDDLVVDTALGIAPEVRNRPSKGLLQEAAGIAADGPKRGFTLPFDSWMRGPLRDWTREALVSDRLPLGWLFESKGRQRLWEAFEDGRAHWSRPWAIAMLRAWADANELPW